MKRMKRLLHMFLVSLIILSLTACGKDKPESIVPNPDFLQIGYYDLLYKDAKIMTDYQGNDALVITLDFTNNSKSSDTYVWSIIESAVQNGKDLELGVVYVDEETLETVTDSQFTEVAPGETIEIKTAFELLDTENEVVVTFEEIYNGNKKSIVISHPSTLSRETTESTNSNDSTKTDTSTSAEVNEELLNWWNGDWYGWWVMTGCYGYYEGMGSMSWDICGTIDIGDDYTGTVVLWDEDYTRNDPMVEASVTLNEAGTGEYGTLMSESGNFTDIPLEHADWIVDPGLVDFPPGMIIIDGYYENGDDEYYYEIHLLPWGSSWDDLGEDFIPYSYYDWYLPLVEAGKPMPDSIDIGA